MTALSTGSVLAQDSTFTGDSTSHQEPKKYDFTLLMGFGGALGSYEHITESGDDDAGEANTDAKSLFGELGVGFRSWGACFYIGTVYGPQQDKYLDDESEDRYANSVRYWPRAFYRISHKGFGFAPEAGYVFVVEDATILDSVGQTASLYDKRSTDQGPAYGLSVGSRLLGGDKLQLWLHGRYIHDNLEIGVDNYWAGLHLLGLVNETSNPSGFPPMQNFRFGLYVRWTERADGRSDWLLTLSLSGVYGLH
jgi:hypothetical protein